MKRYAYTTGTPGTAQETRSYAYGESTWGDLLTVYNGKAITYDAMGNMKSCDGKSYTWQGRELTKIQGGGNTYSYKYNAGGVRTAKTVNGTTTEYFLNGTQILAQKTGDEVMWFFYDSTGQRVGLMSNSHVYYYLYNLQGDVVALVRGSTGQVVARYSYDTWGKCTVTNASGYTVGTKNPFRYRGYYYDAETGLYYLNSRYYSPEWGRFISADSQINTSQAPLGCNLYVYCLNNPINKQDYDGHKPGDLFDTIDEAAHDFALCYNTVSISENLEYAASIYQVTVVEKIKKPVTTIYKFLWWTWTSTSIRTIKIRRTKYTYKTVNKGTPSGVVVPNAPLFKKRVATVHTHAAYDPAYDNDNFSGWPGDKENAQKRGAPNYVATPLGTLRRYDPFDGSDVIIYNDIPWDPNHPGR